MGCFHFFGSHEHLCISFCVDICFHFSWNIPRLGIAGSCGNSVCNHLRSCQAAFQSAYTFYILTSSIRAFHFLHIFTDTLLLSVVLIIAILMDVKWHLLLVLICTSLMANDVEHLFMCLLAIRRYDVFEEMSIQIFCQFYNWVFVFLDVSPLVGK